jgi:hypothetical protein
MEDILTTALSVLFAATCVLRSRQAYSGGSSNGREFRKRNKIDYRDFPHGDGHDEAGPSRARAKKVSRERDLKKDELHKDAVGCSVEDGDWGIEGIMRMRDVEGDGDCFYTAICCALGLGVAYVPWLRNLTADEITNSVRSEESLLAMWNWRHTAQAGALQRTWMNMTSVREKMSVIDLRGAVRLVSDAVRRPREKWATHLELLAARSRLADDHNVILLIGSAGISSFADLLSQARAESSERGVDDSRATYVVLFNENLDHYQYGSIDGISRFDRLLRPKHEAGPNAGPVDLTND